jgi:hypothetical protein
MRKMYDIGQIIGHVAIKGCLKLRIPATMRSFKGKRCFSAEVAKERLDTPSKGVLLVVVILTPLFSEDLAWHLPICS